MKTTLFALIISLSACGTTQDLSAAEQHLEQLSAAMHDVENCGQQNADCRHTDASMPGHHECRDEMRSCIAACRPLQHSPELDALHACNTAYSACAGDDDERDDDDDDDDAVVDAGLLDDGGMPVDCEAEHRACTCTVFTDAWADFCANVTLRCANDTSRLCTRLTASCATPPMPGACR